MADPVKQALRKVKGTFLQKPAPEPLWKQLKAEHDGRIYMEQFWERDKKIKREDSFNKAKLALEVYREGRRQEKERIAEFEKQRLKNLAKARRKLARIRAEGDE